MYGYILCSVSIHASVKDATFSVDSGLGVPPVSIHASVKDATKRQKRAIAAQKVSIHASVKDATNKCYSYTKNILFQSTHL